MDELPPIDSSVQSFPVSSPPPAEAPEPARAPPAAPERVTPESYQTGFETPPSTRGLSSPASGAHEERHREEVARETRVAADQRAALAAIGGNSGFDGPGPRARGPSLGANQPPSTGPRQEVDMTPRVDGSPQWGPGYYVVESPAQVERRSDGLIQGGDGRLYRPERGRGIDGIPPVMPTDPNRVTNPDPVLSIYGIATNAATAADNNRLLADAVNRPVISVRNATEGPFASGDVVETGAQKIGNLYPPSTWTASDIITDRLAQNRPLEIHAHSQGALVTSQSISQARENLIQRHGLTPQEADRRLQLLNVHTYGGASRSFPDGPRYTHNMNTLDPVPGLLGLGNSTIATPLTWGSRPGAGAVLNRQTHLREPHGFGGYLDWVYPPASR